MFRLIFCFSIENKSSESFLNEDDNVDEWDDDEDIDYVDNDDVLISFLNEYYIVYPKKLPKGQIK